MKNPEGSVSPHASCTLAFKKASFLPSSKRPVTVGFGTNPRGETNAGTHPTHLEFLLSLLLSSPGDTQVG